MALIVALVVVLTLTVTADILSSAPRAGATDITGTVKLGATTAINNEQVITQGPNGDVYFAEGKTVKIVKGLSAPATFVHASGFVMAVDATSTDLFVETKTAIELFQLPAGQFEGTWNLPHGIALGPITQGGLSVEGTHLWTWTDWATDESGYEYASVTEFTTSTWTSTVLAKNSADPSDVAASPLGYFFLNRDRFVRADVSGTLIRSTVTADASDAPVATWGPNAWLVATREPSGSDYLDSYNATTMTRTTSVHLPNVTWGVLGTSGGLLGIDATSLSSASGHDYVVSINTRTGVEREMAYIPGAVTLLGGPKVVVVFERTASTYIGRLS